MISREFLREFGSQSCFMVSKGLVSFLLIMSRSSCNFFWSSDDTGKVGIKSAFFFFQKMFAFTPKIIEMIQSDKSGPIGLKPPRKQLNARNLFH